MNFSYNPLNSQLPKYSTKETPISFIIPEAYSCSQGSADQFRVIFLCVARDPSSFSWFPSFQTKDCYLPKWNTAALLVNFSLPGKPGSWEKAFVSPRESMHSLNWANPGHYSHDYGINLNGSGCANQQIP